MLARLTPGFFLLALAAAVAACSSNQTSTPSSGGVPGIGPNFPTNTVYVADTTGEVIDIFAVNPATGAVPQYAISGSNTAMNGPQYLAFGSNKNLYVTNYNAAQSTSSILQFATYATGNVLPVNTFALGSNEHPRGIGMLPGLENFAVAVTNPGNVFSDQLLIYDNGLLTTDIAGSNTLLNVPSGVAVKGGNSIYVADSGSAAVTVYLTPSPGPSPTVTPAPVATPTATPTPVGATPSPTATPAPSSDNIAPVTVVTGPATTLSAPMGVALDSAGNLYVADAGAPAARILVFAAPGPGVQNVAPIRSITSASLIDPMDVKVDAAGLIYVVDRGASPSGSSKLLVFSATANGLSTPQADVALSGADTGLALSP
ncbi:MAG: NHL repeat-containing protein [Candidatus Baltobacteraceae bacterium]